MSVSFDFGEVGKLAANLNEAPRRVAPLVRKAVEITARNVKDDARAISRPQVGSHAALYPYAMEYDLLGTPHQLRAEIGPKPGGGKKNQGDLAPIFETGNPYSGRKASLEPALERNEADFIKGLQKALEDGLNL